MFTLDTHVHSCLSPCAELEMHPAAIIAAARAAALDGIALCDHNAAGNVGAVMRAGRRAGVWVVAGMEITSAEEAHVQALLPDEAAARELEARVQAALPGQNDPAAFGLQVLADEDQTVLGYDEHLLSGATTWTLEEVVAQVHQAGGLAVGAHVDRESFGIIGQLGLVPPGLELDALEVSAQTSLPKARRTFGAGQTLLCSSDAHQPGGVGRGKTFFWMQAPTFPELRLALGGRDGRAVLGGGRPMEDLSLHLLDIAQNAVEAGARRIAIEVREDEAADTLVLQVADDGRGMSPDAVKRAQDPFFTTRTTRRVGLGLALFSEAARATGGAVTVESREGQGTTVRGTFGHGHLDRQPLGDLESTLLVLIAGNPGVQVTYRRQARGRTFELDSRQLEQSLGEPLTSPRGLAALRAALREGERRFSEDMDDEPQEERDASGDD